MTWKSAHKHVGIVTCSSEYVQPTPIEPPLPPDGTPPLLSAYKSLWTEIQYYRLFLYTATLDTPPLSTYRHPRNIATKFGEQTGLALWQPDWQCFERQSEFSPWCCYCSSVALWCAPMHRHTGPASTQMKMYFVILLFGCCTYLHALLQSMFQKKKRTRVAIVILLLKCCTTIVLIFPGLSRV